MYITDEEWHWAYRALEAQEIYLRTLRPNKGNNMNEIIGTETEIHSPNLVEILDADGNPTGQYTVAGAGEASQEGAEVYTTAEDGDHAVTVH